MCSKTSAGIYKRYGKLYSVFFLFVTETATFDIIQICKNAKFSLFILFILIICFGNCLVFLAYAICARTFLLSHNHTLLSRLSHSLFLCAELKGISYRVSLPDFHSRVICPAFDVYSTYCHLACVFRSLLIQLLSGRMANDGASSSSSNAAALAAQNDPALAIQIPIESTSFFPQYGNVRNEATVSAATNTRPETRVELHLFDIKVHGNGSFGWVC